MTLLAHHRDNTKAVMRIIKLLLSTFQWWRHQHFPVDTSSVKHITCVHPTKDSDISAAPSGPLISTVIRLAFSSATCQDYTSASCLTFRHITAYQLTVPGVRWRTSEWGVRARMLSERPSVSIQEGLVNGFRYEHKQRLILGHSQ